MELDSYEYSRKHLGRKYALPRTVIKNVDGTRSLYYRLGVHFPGFENRLFENWFTWKKVKLSNGKTAYLLGFGPLSKFERTRFDDLSTKAYKVGEVLAKLIVQ